MSDRQLNTPVCLIIFKRPDTTQKVFEALRQVKPAKLLVIADGPRPDKPGELEKCQATRQIIEKVDWECEVLKNYSDTNMGLKHRVASGLDWVFNNVEEAIILEDDCLPDPTFFRFSEELLDYYRYNQQVMVITGTNFLFGWKPNNYSYYFSRYIDCWGWATWRRAWQYFDFEMKQWPELRDNNWLLKLFKEPQVAEQWTRTFQATYDGHINSWAFRWKFACWLQNGLTIIPEKNLVSNIGFNVDSTNTINVDSLLASTPVEEISFPLKHPNTVIREEKVDEFIQKTVFTRNLSYLRHQIANLWLNITSEELNSVIKQDAINRILNTRVREESFTDTEENFIKDLILNMSREFDENQAIQYLLVAMLYKYPHQFPVQYDLSKIPNWLLNNYVKFLFDAPSCFQEIGEVDNYYHHINKAINCLHSYIFSSPESKNAQDIAISFAANANLFLYFCKYNLKDIYKKRAEILEFALKLKGYNIDYDFPSRLPARNKIRFGILANNFDPHPETFATLPLYKYLNREIFEIILYSLQTSGHRLERYCSGHADAVVQLPESLENQVKTIRNDDLDILFISPNVTAQTNVISLLALHRLARLQMVGMNSPVTTGMRHIDYYISGNITELKNNSEKDYTEKLLTLDGIDQCFDFGTEEQLLITTKISRENLGIAEDAVVYISGANFYKIIPEVEAVWAKILANVPNSTLVLYPFNPNWAPTYPIETFKKRFFSRLSKHGISENRLILLTPLPNRADIKECLKVANIYLDTYPFSGMSSLIDPLEVGLPIVVMEGEYSRSRRGASLLRSLQIPELIANNEEAYVNLATTLGTKQELQKQYQEHIRQKIQNNPQFLDSRIYSYKFDILCQKTFQNYLTNELKANLNLKDINLIIFPDWSQSEELLYQDFARVLKAIASHPDKTKMTLLIDNSNISDEDADIALSSIVMNLLMEEELDVEEGPEMSIIGELSKMQWEALKPLLQGRVILDNENKEKVNQVKVENTYSF
ncbi:MAG: methyltransferase type 11 [Okeania sp. SIO3B5]|uniref:O-linked N-acetylglucosamine transferase, SPINDLY family protein n=1 Tax=Okeania sp. SIO3B5 TaxID=2607811 RepID=UPI0013FE72B8|nr:methyltransferase type 11 [Okeania sp. SIO3B5]NEO52975.1 methyltransferase type 11 [Okeania sp. SIO3B5]